MTEEHEIQKKIQVAVSQRNCTIFRANVGKILLSDGGYFDTGLPKGFPDLFGFRWCDHHIFFIEVKSKTGEPSEEQVIFHEFLQSHQIIHGLARSEKDALLIVEGGLIGYGY